MFNDHCHQVSTHLQSINIIIIIIIIIIINVKQFRNRPGVAQRVPGGLGSQIFMTFGT